MEKSEYSNNKDRQLYKFKIYYKYKIIFETLALEMSKCL